MMPNMTGATPRKPDDTTTYGVVFQSRQSYYQLLADAAITYKQAQRSNPKHDPERVAAKKKR